MIYAPLHKRCTALIMLCMQSELSLNGFTAAVVSRMVLEQQAQELEV
jgi:hypothetical protein